MKSAAVLLACLLFTAAAPAQTRAVLESKGDFLFSPNESILAHQLTGDNKLVLVGRKSVRVLDFAAAKFGDPRALETAGLDKDDRPVISPAGRAMLVVPSDSSRPAVVWDLETGRPLKELKASRPIRSAFWSGDGRVLVTTSNTYAPIPFGDTAIEVAFWDGETLEHLSTLPTEKVGWWHLTADGRTCFFSEGKPRNILVAKYIRPESEEVNVWGVRTGKVEQTIGPGGGEIIRGVYVSPRENYLAYAAQPPKSKDAGRHVAVFEIVKGAARYELKLKKELRPVPVYPQMGAMFSPGDKYFAVDAGKRTQIYESASGEKKLELANFVAPNGWLNDETFLHHVSGQMNAFDVATGKLLYEQKQVYEEYSEPTSYSSDDNSFSSSGVVVTDRTQIRVHPSGRVFLTYSNQYVRVYDTRTGALVQVLVAPVIDYDRKKPRLSDKTLVMEAGWSYDGRALYVFNIDDRTVSLWQLLDT
jgi:WD40 repeat protein